MKVPPTSIESLTGARSCGGHDVEPELGTHCRTCRTRPETGSADPSPGSVATQRGMVEMNGIASVRIGSMGKHPHAALSDELSIRLIANTGDSASAAVATDTASAGGLGGRHEAPREPRRDAERLDAHSDQRRGRTSARFEPQGSPSARGQSFHGARPRRSSLSDFHVDEHCGSAYRFTDSSAQSSRSSLLPGARRYVQEELDRAGTSIGVVRPAQTRFPFPRQDFAAQQLGIPVPPPRER